MILTSIILAATTAIPDTRCLRRTQCPTVSEVRDAVIAWHGKDGDFLRTHDDDVQIRELRHPRSPDIACQVGKTEDTAVCGFVVLWRAQVEKGNCQYSTAAGSLQTMNCPGGSSVIREVHYIANFRRTDGDWQITSAEYVVGT